MNDDINLETNRVLLINDYNFFKDNDSILINYT